VIDVMEELYKFTVLLCHQSDYLANRYSERNAKGIQEGLEKMGKTLNGINLEKI
jgi:arsenical resistance protein ArsH